jgi:hypothetical protein
MYGDMGSAKNFVGNSPISEDVMVSAYLSPFEIPRRKQKDL